MTLLATSLMRKVVTMAMVMTDKQRAFALSLSNKKGIELPPNFALLTASQASVLIDKLVNAPYASNAQKPWEAVADGVYIVPEGGDKVVYRVQVGKTGFKSFSRLIPPAVMGGKGKYERVQRGWLICKPEYRATLEEASALGFRWGICIVCGRLLTNEKSVDLGIGPVCRGEL